MSNELFEQLGGAKAIAEIVDKMYDAVLADDELAPFFAHTDMRRLRRMQFEFIASALGGPVSYSGAELQAIHAGRGITPHHFSRFVGHLADAMEDQGATRHQVDQMLGTIAMYRDRIVGSANVDG
jgi:hemoglobin